MSRTLSKVLIICALVVVLPLMIAGTAMAAYYSINATVSIEIFVEKTIDGATAEVSYKDKVANISKDLKITDGHLKTVTFKTYAVGYDFVGWYAGTHEAYVKELEQGKTIDTVKYAITTPDAKVEMTEYQNLVAVFKAKRFNVSYKYFQKPSGLGGVEVNEVPTSKHGLIVDGKPAPETIPEATQVEEFIYGDALHTLEFEGHPEYTFDGWYIGDDTTKYTKANFTESENIVLTGKWVDSKRINLTYLDDKGNELKKVTTTDKKPVYANKKYTLDSIDSFKTQLENGGYEFKNGYTYGWQDVSTGSIVTEINSDTDVVVQVSKSAVVYKARIDFEGSGLTLNDKIASELNFSDEDSSSLSIWQNASSWNADHKFWKFAYLTYNDARVDDMSAIVSQVIAANPHETAEITFKVVKESIIDKVNIEVDFASNSGMGYSGKVYKGKTLLTERPITNIDNFDISLYTVFDLMEEGSSETLAKFYKDSNEEQEVSLANILFPDNGYAQRVFSEDLKDVNDLIDLLYEIDSNLESKIVEGVLSFKIIICFD